MTPLEFRSARKRLKLTQREAAKLGRTSWSTILRYEQGYMAEKLRPTTGYALRRVYDAMINRLPDDPLADDKTTDWSKLDVKLRDPQTKKTGAEPPVFMGHGDAWLRTQARASLRELAVGRFESQELGALYIVSPAAVEELCRRVVTALKRKHEANRP